MKLDFFANTNMLGYMHWTTMHQCQFQDLGFKKFKLKHKLAKIYWYALIRRWISLPPSQFTRVVAIDIILLSLSWQRYKDSNVYIYIFLLLKLDLNIFHMWCTLMRSTFRCTWRVGVMGNSYMRVLSILRNSDLMIFETSKLEGGKTFLIIIITVDDKFLQALSSLSLSVVVEYLKILLSNCYLKKFHCQEHFLNIWNDFEYLIAMISFRQILRSIAWRTIVVQNIVSQ